MSAAIVRKALEISLADEEGLSKELIKTKSKLKNKLIQKKKKKPQSAEDTLKQNLKILRAIDSISSSYQLPLPKSSQQTKSIPITTTTGSSAPKSDTLNPGKKSKKKRSKKAKKQTIDSGFTEDDFKKFEAEYFVTD